MNCQAAAKNVCGVLQPQRRTVSSHVSKHAQTTRTPRRSSVTNATYPAGFSRQSVPARHARAPPHVTSTPALRETVAGCSHEPIHTLQKVDHACMLDSDRRMPYKSEAMGRNNGLSFLMGNGVHGKLRVELCAHCLLQIASTCRMS